MLDPGNISSKNTIEFKLLEDLKPFLLTYEHTATDQSRKYVKNQDLVLTHNKKRYHY